MKILQLLNDWVFDNSVLSVFSTMTDMEVDNRYVVFRTSDDKDLRKIESPHLVEAVQIGTVEYEKLKSEEWDVVWVHALTGIKAQFIFSLPNRPIVMWSTWGYDYVRFAGRWLYGPRTTRLWLKAISRKSAIKDFLTYVVAKTPWSRFLPYTFCRFFRMVDFYSTVVPEEEPFLSRILGPSAKRLPFHYVGKKSNEVPKVDLMAKRIWVGNSATLTNNHLDVFPFLEKYRDFEICVPLSYSTTAEDKASAEIVESEGRVRFGGRFFPIKDFLPRADYVKRMKECSVFIFAHLRQQALGNINLALKMGGCVIMDDRSPVFRYLRCNGIVAYTLQDLRRKGIGWIVNDFKPRQDSNIANTWKVRNYDAMKAEITGTVRFLAEEVVRRNQKRAPK